MSRTVSEEMNVDYTLSTQDEDKDTVGYALGLSTKDHEAGICDISVTAEYTYHSGAPQTYWQPEEYSYYEIEDFYIAGYYGENGKVVPITKEQSDMLLNLKPSLIDTDKLTDIISDRHTDLDQEDYRS